MPTSPQCHNSHSWVSFTRPTQPGVTCAVRPLQEVVNSGIQSIVLRVGATNVDDSLAAQSAIALGRQGSKPSGATITKSQVPIPAPCSHASMPTAFLHHMPEHRLSNSMIRLLLDKFTCEGKFLSDLHIVTLTSSFTVLAPSGYLHNMYLHCPLRLRKWWRKHCNRQTLTWPSRLGRSEMPSQETSLSSWPRYTLSSPHAPPVATSRLP